MSGNGIYHDRAYPRLSIQIAIAIGIEIDGPTAAPLERLTGSAAPQCGKSLPLIPIPISISKGHTKA